MHNKKTRATTHRLLRPAVLAVLAGLAGVLGLAGAVPGAHAQQTVEVLGARPAGALADEAGRLPTVANVQSATSIRPADAPTSMPVRLEDLALWSPGVLVEPANAGLSSAVKMRGFAVTRLHRDGLPDVQRMYTRDLSTVQRVDFIQGPAGALVGITSPGGMVQFIGKRPQAVQSTDLQVTAGQNRFGRFVIDHTGPVMTQPDAASASPDLRYRLIGSLQDGQTDLAHLPTRHQQALAALEWHHADGWVGIDLQEQHNQTPFTFGTVITNGGAAGRAVQAADVAWDRLFVLDGGAPAARRYHDARLHWQHNGPGDWRLRLVLGQATVTRDETLLGFWALTSPSTLSSYWTRYHDSYRQRAARFDLQRQVRWGAWTHDLSIGADRYRQGFLFDGLQNIGAFSINIAAPEIAPLASDPSPTTRRYNDERIDERGLWLADKLSLADGLELTAAVRQQAYEIASARSPKPRKTVGNAAAATWLTGLSWRPGPQWRAWASAASGMDANRGTRADGGFLPAQRSMQGEAGLEVRQGGFSGAASLWQINLDQLAMTDPADRTALVAGGGRRVQGVQVQASCGDELLGSSGHLSVQRTQQTVRTSATLGDRFVGVPDQQGALHGWWRLPLPDLAALTLTASINAVGPRMGDAANTVRVPGFARADLGLKLPAGPGHWLLQIRNVADLRYVESVTRVDDVFQGARRQARLGWQGHW